MSLFASLFGGFGRPPSPRGPRDHRAYAVGDIHGRLDLLDMMIAKIEADLAERPAKRTLVVFLGDLIDRGPQSAGVVERLRTWRPAAAEPVFLSGNHEEILLRLLGGERGLLQDWLMFGGTQCLASYGVPAESLKALDEDQALAAIRAAIPDAHQSFIAGFADTLRFGDYLFVHAGIRPGIALDAQAHKDLRWIRQPFLDDASDHGFTVVHGHTISETVEERANRIGIDTGAYHTGVLTAVAIEDSERWFIDTAGG